MEMVQSTLGFVGLGHMGAPMVRRLLQAGHAVHVHDRDAATLGEAARHGARPEATAAGVAQAAEIVFLCLPTPEIVRSVALDGLHGDRLAIVADLSTTGPAMAVAVAAGLAARGVRLLDCPVSGGIAGAAAGTLSIMAAGPDSAYRAVAPLLRCFGTPHHVGPEAGQAQILKLVNNLLSAAALAVTAEGLAMGVKAGLDPRAMLAVINGGSGRNSATVAKFPDAVLTRRFDFGFPIGLAQKDIRLCLEQAERLGAPTPVGSAVRQVLAMTAATFGAEADFTSVARLYETWAGVTIGDTQ